MTTREEQERLYRELASRYTEQYGRELLAERQRLLAQRAVEPSPAMERQVRRQVRALKHTPRESSRRVSGRAPVARYASVAAVCLVAVALLALLSGRFGAFSPAPAAPAPSAAPAVPPSATAMPPGESDGAQSMPSTAPAPPVSPPQAETPTEQIPVIPLGFTPPERFDNTAFAQDDGKSIYYFDDALGDDLVLVMERLDTAELPDIAWMEELLINGHQTYGVYLAEYSMLVFEKDGLLYTLTCKHDLNTLIRMGEAILA